MTVTPAAWRGGPVDDPDAIPTTAHRHFPGYLILSCCECGAVSPPSKVDRLVRREQIEAGTSLRRTCRHCRCATQHIVMPAADFHDPHAVAEELIGAFFDLGVIVRRGKRDHDVYGVNLNRYLDDGSQEVYLFGPIEYAELVPLLRMAHQSLSAPDEEFRSWFDGMRTRFFESPTNKARASYLPGYMTSCIASACRGLPSDMDAPAGPTLADYAAQLRAVLDPAECEALAAFLKYGGGEDVLTEEEQVALAGEFDLGSLSSSHIHRYRQTVFW